MLHSVRVWLARLTGNASSRELISAAAGMDTQAPGMGGSEVREASAANDARPTASSPLPWRQAVLGRAQALVTAGQLDNAIGLLETSLRTHPDEEVALALDELRTIRQMRKRLQRQPNDSQAHFALGQALFAQDRGAEALPHLERACQLRPAWLEAHLLRAYELQWQGRWREAEAAYQTVLSLSPTHTMAQRGLRAVHLYQAPDSLLSHDLAATDWLCLAPTSQLT